MAVSCEICGKSYLKGNKVSHANNRTIRRWMPNLRRVRAKIGKVTRYVRVCTSCLKAGKVVKAA
jgi:large subunit ribosomal protein L28